MLIVVDNVRDKHREDIQLFNLILQVAYSHEIMHGLQRVNDMSDIVVRVLFEVALSDLLWEVEQGTDWNMELGIQFVLQEYVVHDVGECSIV